MYFVYVLRSKKDNKRYIGFTENLERRLSEHVNGLVKSTRNRRPIELLFFENYETKKEAMEREEFLKSGYGRAYLSSINK